VCAVCYLVFARNGDPSRSEAAGAARDADRGWAATEWGRADGGTAAPAQGELTEVRLEVGRRALERLERGLPASAGEVVDARLLMAGRSAEIGLSYRGDVGAPWQPGARSFFVETRRQDAIAGMRRLHLTRPGSPNQLQHYLTVRLAHSLGILAPRAMRVRLRVNGEYHGVYVLSEDVDESTLRALRRMPGDVYERTLRWSSTAAGVTVGEFCRPEAWRKIAVDSRRDADADAPLRALLGGLAAPGSSEQRRDILRMIDIEAMARMSVLELLTQAHRQRHFEKWRLYYDPWRGRFEPVLWDSLDGPAPGDGAAAIELDALPTPLHRVLYDHAGFLVARQRILGEWIRGEGWPGFSQELAATLAAATTQEGRDAAAVGSGPGRVPAVVAAVEEQVLGGPLAARYAVAADGGLAVSVRSHRAPREVRLWFDGPTVPQGVRVAKLDAEETWVDLQPTWRVDGDAVVLDLPLPSAMGPRAGDPGGVQPLRTGYRLRCEGVGERRIVGVSIGSEAARAVAADEVVGATEHRAGLDGVAELWGRRAAPIVWSGRVEVRGVQTIREEVIIEPGTVLEMEPGAALVFRGRVTAVGSENAPIRVVPARAGAAPWGCVALHGAGCDGSKLAFWELDGGAGIELPLVRYTGMLSLHQVQGATLTDCLLDNGQGEDEAMHLVYTEAVLERVTVRDSEGDGVDCEQGVVTVRDCEFERCEDDGLDLMGTRALVVGTRISRCDDKGISAGEMAIVAVVDCTIRKCGMAIEAKEGSAAFLIHCAVSGGKTLLAATRENWRYGRAGSIVVHRSTLDGDAEDVLEGTGRIELHDCRLEVDPVRPPGLQAVVRGCSAELAAGSDPVPVPIELGVLGPAASEAWSVQWPDRGRK